MKHFIDEDYDSTEEYESNLLHHADDYKDGDYYDKPIINFEQYPDDWYEGTIIHFKD
jgi:hypothetical protein